MSNYRRKLKPKTEHIKKGFTVFQKTIATLASILGLITASITIMNALDKNNNVQSEETTQASNNVPKNQTDGVAQSDTVATDNKTNP